jgi:hypothetical protein
LVKAIFLNPTPRRYVQPATAPIPSPMIACVSSWRVFEWLSLSAEPDPPFYRRGQPLSGSVVISPSLCSNLDQICESSLEG